MKRFATLLLGLGLVASATASAEPSAGGKIRVLLTHGGHAFDKAPFFGMFDAMPNIRYQTAEFPKELDRLAPELRKQIDVLVMYDMNPKIEPRQQEAFKALLEAGIGVVALHHNLGAHRNWPDYHRIIGGRFVLAPMEIDGKAYPKSTWSHDEQIKVTIADRGHPITRGIADFTIHDETYGGLYVSPQVHVLLRTDHPKNSPQLGWVTTYGRSKVVCLMLGHDGKAYADPNYRELLARSIRYAAGK